jgi:hypothetical protein
MKQFSEQKNNFQYQFAHSHQSSTKTITLRIIVQPRRSFARLATTIAAFAGGETSHVYTFSPLLTDLGNLMHYL